ncbi:MAG: radical SAM protein [Desulfobacteraceae bacterium]|nr:radical SAM protein [Desulfobacteraceae bacterium]
MSNRLSNNSYRMAHVMFTRGCPFNCNFCSSGNRYVQFRCPKNIRNELIFLKEKYKIEGFAIVDDNAIINKKKTMEYCALIEDLNLKWSALSRVDTVNREILESMSTSGCIEIKYGIESGSQKILDMMNKKISLDQIKHTVRLTKHFGIKVKAFIIHGFPGEDLETTQETIQLLKEIHQFIDRITVFRFVPLPGSPVYENYREFNIHGTHYHKEWDGNWNRFRIYNNDTHWWGSHDDYLNVKKSYNLLISYVKSIFPDEI